MNQLMTIVPGLKNSVSRNRIPWIILSATLALFIPLMVLMWPNQDVRSTSIVQAEAYHSALVTAVDGKACDGIIDNEMPCVKLEANVGDKYGTSVITTRGDLFTGVEPGDKIVVSEVRSEGSTYYAFHSMERMSGLLWLAALAALLVVLVTGRKGVVSLLGMAIAYALFWFFLLPGISQGGDPVDYAIVTCALVLVVVLYGTHGVNLKTTAALIGTVSGLLAAVVCGTAFSFFTNLSGVTDETQMILLQGEAINLKTLAMAGLMVASLGVLNDITVAQASTVWSIARHHSGNMREVVRQALAVGRDHASSAIYTITFSLVGASLGAMVLAGGQGMTLWAWIQDEAVTETLVQVLVGAIGLVLAMPLTTLIAVFLYHRDKGSASKTDQSVTLH